MVEELVAEIHKATGNFKLWAMSLSYASSEDLGGVPFPNKDKTRVTYLLPEELPFDTEEAGIICLDEFDRSGPDVQNSALQLLLGGKIHGHKLSPNAYTVIAMNGCGDIYTTPLSTAAATRVCSLFVSSGSEDYSNSYEQWAEANGISPMMRSFAKFSPELLMEHEDFEEIAKPVPRSRDMADRILKAIDEVTFKTDDIILPLIAGVIGKAAAIKLLAFRDICKQLPTCEEVIRNPINIDIPDAPNVKYALIGALVEHVRTINSDKKINNLIKFFIRMPDELTAIALRKLHKYHPNIVTDPDYVKWSDSHSYILELN